MENTICLWDEKDLKRLMYVKYPSSQVMEYREYYYFYKI